MTPLSTGSAAPAKARTSAQDPPLEEHPPLGQHPLSVGATSRQQASSCQQPSSWQQAMKDAVRDPVELCRLVGLPPRYHEAAQRAARDFTVFVPQRWIARMRYGDTRDPLLLQVLPLAEELNWPTEFTADPVGDRLAGRKPGLLCKYSGRVLLVTTGVCAVHCRYCFRRHFPYAETPRGREAWRPALEEIEQDPTLSEVILSGGDPLTLVDEVLSDLVAGLARIGHLRRLRIHTRLPIMIPQRVTDALLTWLRGTRLTPVVVVHVNHPAELDDDVADALARLADAGVPLLNQTVLLRGINDQLDTLVELSERLIDCRVMPYYLHQLDRVAGAAHFEVAESTGRRLVEQMRARLPGYAVPRYVREEPGAAYKIGLADP